jgi:uncharacterized Zn finger protein (UPF0148 family)
MIEVSGATHNVAQKPLAKKVQRIPGIKASPLVTEGLPKKTKKTTKVQKEQINLETKHKEFLAKIIKPSVVPQKTKDESTVKNIVAYYSKALPCLIEYYNTQQPAHQQNTQQVDDEDNVQLSDKTHFIDIVARAAEQKHNASKASILDKFLLRFDHKYCPNTSELDINCKFCGSNLNHSSTEGELMCITCGYTKQAVLEGVKMSYKELSTRQTNENYSYSKCGHLDFHLQHFQGKPVPLPDGLKESILEEMAADSIQPKSLTIKRMRDYLYRLGFSKFYENSNYIIELCGGPKAPRLDKEYIDLVRSLFAKILIPFRKLRKELFSNTNNQDRRNLVIYNYILYKIFELTDRCDLLKQLYLLKTTKINIQLEHFWYYTCKDCGFKYIK